MDADIEYINAARRELAEPAERGPQCSELTPLGALLLAEFAGVEAERLQTEERLLKDLRQYLGIYEPEIESGLAGRSKVFQRKTRVKVKAADSRMFDLMFPASAARNYDIQATQTPKVSRNQLAEIISGTSAKLGRAPSQYEITSAVREWVGERAKKMGNTIDDQLVEARYRRIAKKILHSGHLYGTGVLKGPLVERKTRTNYVQSPDGKWTARTLQYATPFIDFVPLWRWYPDMGATEIEECRYVYELHAMSKRAMQELSERKSFDSAAIRAYLMANPKGQPRKRYVDSELRSMGDRRALNEINSGQYWVLERWGWLDATELSQVGVSIPENRMHETFFANVWVLPDGTVIKAAIHTDFKHLGELYYLYQFDKDETSIFANGIPAIMRDDQDMINASTRMILDNGAITCGPQMEINVRALSGMTDITSMHPFKLWLRSGEDAANPAVRAINLDSHLSELIEIRRLFDESSDETTAIPRYMTGENATQGAAGTSSGMSMLMGAASMQFKDLVAAYDEDITKPFVTRMNWWNMRYNPDDSIKGEYDVSAIGAASLVAKEVRSAQLATFGQTVQPEERAYVDWYRLLQEKVRASEIPDAVVKDENQVKHDESTEEARRQALLVQRQQELQVALLEKQVAKLGAEVAKLQASAVQSNVDAAYAAMQAGGVAATNPAAAAGGDEILRSAGWVDATPQDTTTTAVEEGPAAAAAQPGAVPPRAGALAGHMRGVETPEIEAAYG